MPAWHFSEPSVPPGEKQQHTIQSYPATKIQKAASFSTDTHRYIVMFDFLTHTFEQVFSIGYTCKHTQTDLTLFYATDKASVESVRLVSTSKQGLSSRCEAE